MPSFLKKYQLISGQAVKGLEPSAKIAKRQHK